MGEDGAKVQEVDEDQPHMAFNSHLHHQGLQEDHGLLMGDISRYSDVEDDEDHDFSGLNPASSATVGRNGIVREDEEFCEVAPPTRSARMRYSTSSHEEDDDEEFDPDDDDRRRSTESVIYPPERVPPIMDFLTVLSAFVVAVVAAYYTISM